MSTIAKQFFLLIFFLTSGTILAANEEATRARLQTLIDSDSRSEDARARNQYRHP